MKIKLISVFLFIFFFVVSCNKNQVKTEDNIYKEGKFTSNEAGFEADFPCQPKKYSDLTGNGLLDRPITFYECNNGVAAFSVSFEDITEKINNPKLLFEAKKKQRLEGMQESAKVVSETEKTVNNFPAAYFETEQDINGTFPRAFVISRLQVLRDQRYYSVSTTVLSKEGKSSKDIDKEIRDKTKQFIDSFKVIQKN